MASVLVLREEAGVAPSHRHADFCVRSKATHRTKRGRRRNRIGVDNGAPRGSSMPLGEKNMDGASSTAPITDREANTARSTVICRSPRLRQRKVRSWAAHLEAPWQAQAPADPTAPARAWTTSTGFAGLRMIGVAGHSRSIVSGS